MPFQLNVMLAGKRLEPTLECSNRKVLHSGRIRPYSQTLDHIGRGCLGQTFQKLHSRVGPGLTHKYKNRLERPLPGATTLGACTVKLFTVIIF